jgi:hypothetical protein
MQGQQHPFNHPRAVQAASASGRAPLFRAGSTGADQAGRMDDRRDRAPPVIREGLQAGKAGGGVGRLPGRVCAAASVAGACRRETPQRSALPRGSGRGIRGQPPGWSPAGVPAVAAMTGPGLCRKSETAIYSMRWQLSCKVLPNPPRFQNLHREAVDAAQVTDYLPAIVSSPLG